ncbi:MAG: UDP-N-acetylglucosamine 1-carboxyvinyltransferase [bacterium]|nr:UDP-N-acetylglucosamine 1-carboxyvinyltransferase [bacterium]
MATFRIIGGKPLRGTVEISGRKNAALPILAASLLTTGKVTIEQVPEIGDVAVMLEILEALGSTVEHNGTTLSIQTKQLNTTVIPTELAQQLRGSLLFLGPVVARAGSITLPHPGGCIIGKRPVGLHFDVLESLGARINNRQANYTVSASRGLKGTQIFLPEASVTGTENAVMAAVLAKGKTELVNTANEDHVGQLIFFLRELGYQIKGVGKSVVQIEGSNGVISTKNIHLKLIPDEIEMGTFITCAIVTKGALTLTNVGENLISLPIRAIFNNFGVKPYYDERRQTIIIRPPYRLKPAQIKTGTWPGIPTDLQPPLALLGTQVNGNTLIHDWMFEGRFAYVASLEKMGATILTCDPHRIVITGPTPLHGTKLVSPDLRAGITQLIAALAATGESIIEHAELIDRGYAKIVERLEALGADIERLA